MRDAPARPASRRAHGSAPAEDPNLPVAGEHHDEDDEHGLEISPRGLLTLGLFLALAIAALYFVLPQLAGLQDTWHRIQDGSPWWILLALVFTAGLFAGYVIQFRGVFLREGGHRIDWRAAYEITMAGLAASRLFAAGGAGGLVLTAWALRRSGMERRRVADTTLAFLILTYFPYAGALAVAGAGLYFGIFPGDHPFSLTLLPAILSVAAFVVALVGTALVPPDLQRRVGDPSPRAGRLARLARKVANAPAAASAGMRLALRHLRSPDPALLGASMFWGFQILVLWAAFKAFGDAPPAAVLVQAFFLGMLGNLLPLPGGVGGVEGGMIGALVAFDVHAGLAVVAVLVFRAFTFWLPLLPGVIAYFSLRRTVQRWRDTIQSEVRDPRKGASAVHGT